MLHNPYKGSSIIDLYVHPSLGGVAFINGQRLLEHAQVRELNGVEVRTLESYAEALRFGVNPETGVLEEVMRQSF